MTGFHLTTATVLPLAAVPLTYAGGQLASAIAAPITGFGYDRVGHRVLHVLPLLIAAVAVLQLATWVLLAVTGRHLRVRRPAD
ncbi:hypothetical protein HJ590_10385 [Naumannella sp. ID2617S]|nr:hypothetical protein [Naumannella sp. ID2617S]